MRNYEKELSDWMRAKQLCFQTKEEYLSLLRKYLGFCYHEGLFPEDMPHEGLVAFMAEASCASSGKQRKAMLTNLYEFVLGQGFKLYGLPNPKQRIKVPESLSPDQIRRIFDVVPKTREGKKQLLILKMMYGCGLRVTEATTVHINDFRKKFNPETEKEYFELKITGKGTKERLVPVPDETMNEIISHINNRGIKGYLFKGQFRDCYSAKSVQNVFMRAKRACGITTPGNTHLLRKSRTTRFIDAQMNDRNVMLYFGWSNQKTINHYHRASTAAMKTAIDQIDKQESKQVLLTNPTEQPLLKQA